MFYGAVFEHSISGASSAISVTVFIYERILFGKLVIVGAVSFFGVDGRRPNSPNHIDTSGDRLKVEWIDAPSVSTEMVNLQARWNRISKLFKSKPMSQMAQKIPIACSVHARFPLPAAGLKPFNL